MKGKVLQDRSEACYDVCFGDCGAGNNRAGGESKMCMFSLDMTSMARITKESHKSNIELMDSKRERNETLYIFFIFSTVIPAGVPGSTSEYTQWTPKSLEK